MPKGRSARTGSYCTTRHIFGHRSSPPVAAPPSGPRTGTLTCMWWANVRIGWPERVRGLHYWLGWEYGLVADRIRPAEGRVLDIGTGAHSVWPYLLSSSGTDFVVSTDPHPAFERQHDRQRRAGRTLRRASAVGLVRCDARELPIRDDALDAVSAISTIEHIRGAAGDRQALQDIARVLQPGGRVWLTVPYTAEASKLELNQQMEHFQWHYSDRTLGESLVGPSGLREVRRVLYGERLPYYALSRRLPAAVQWLMRPWDTVLAAVLMRTTLDGANASAVMVELEKTGRPQRCHPDHRHSTLT